MSDNKHLMIVDDDPKICELTKEFLQSYHYKISTAANGEELFKLLATNTPDLIILDIMLPDQSGFDICRRLRDEGNRVPIIMLTAVSDDTDRILGIEIGADDYLTKPFNPRELLARIRGLFRRASHPLTSAGTQYQFNDWILDQLSRRLISPEQIDVPLTDAEYRLLEALVTHSQRVLSREFLLDITQNREAGPFDRTIDVRISRLRQKLGDDPKNPGVIKTIRGGGYMFTCQVSIID